MYAAWFTHRGGRPENQDAVCVGGTVWQQDMDDVRQARLQHADGARFFVVADGVGGHAGGAVAAATILQVFAAMEGAPVAEPLATLSGILLDAQSRLLTVAAATPALRYMGAALAGIVDMSEEGDALILFSCGDVRIYGVHSECTELLTMDHSLARKAVTNENFAGTKYALYSENLLTAMISANQHYRHRHDAVVVPKGRYERFIICTDGVWRQLSSSTATAPFCITNQFTAAQRTKDAVLLNADNVGFLFVDF